MLRKAPAFIALSVRTAGILRCKVRYYGILAIKNRTTKLRHCFALIGKAQLPPRFEGLD